MISAVSRYRIFGGLSFRRNLALIFFQFGTSIGASFIFPILGQLFRFGLGRDAKNRTRLGMWRNYASRVATHRAESALPFYLVAAVTIIDVSTRRALPGRRIVVLVLFVSLIFAAQIDNFGAVDDDTGMTRARFDFKHLFYFLLFGRGTIASLDAGGLMFVITVHSKMKCAHSKTSLISLGRPTSKLCCIVNAISDTRQAIDFKHHISSTTLIQEGGVS